MCLSLSLLPLLVFPLSSLSLRLLCAGPSAVLGPLSLSPDCRSFIPDVLDLDLCPPGDSSSPLVSLSLCVFDICASLVCCVVCLERRSCDSGRFGDT